MASAINSDGENHKNFNRDIKDMVSKITTHTSDLHKPGASHHGHEDDDSHGVRIITLAGTNSGATMRAELDHKDLLSHGHHDDHDTELPAKTYVNSNFQAVNNSIMMSSSYITNDPGVHMEVSDFIEHDQHKPEKHEKKDKEKKNKKDKEKEEHSNE